MFVGLSTFIGSELLIPATPEIVLDGIEVGEVGSRLVQGSFKRRKATAILPIRPEVDANWRVLQVQEHRITARECY